jgi:hypothetical protein
MPVGVMTAHSQQSFVIRTNEADAAEMDEAMNILQR